MSIEADGLINITLSDGNAEATLAALMAKIDALSSSSIPNLNSATAKAEESHQELAAAVQHSGDVAEQAGHKHEELGEKSRESGEKAGEAAEEHGKLGEAVERVGGQASVLSNILGGLGINVGESTEKVKGITESISAIGETIPAVIIGTGALVAAFAAFDFVKDALGDASKSLKDLEAIGTMAKLTGGNFNEAAESVDKFAQDIAVKTGISKEAYISGIQEMVAAGLSVTNAEKAENAAAALSLKTGRDLIEVNSALLNLYEQRPRQAEKMGALTKAEADAGITFNEVIQRQANSLGEVLPAALSQSAAQFGVLNVKVSEAIEGIGNNFEPAALAVALALNDLFDGAAKAAEGFSTFLDKFVQTPQFVGLATIALGALSVAFLNLTRQAALFALELTGQAVVSLSIFSATIYSQTLTALGSMFKFLTVDMIAAIGKFSAELTAQGVVTLVTFSRTILANVIPSLIAFGVSMLEVLAPIAVVGAAIFALYEAWTHNFLGIQNITDIVINFAINRFGDLVRVAAAAVNFLGNVAHALNITGLGNNLHDAADGMDKFGQSAEKANLSIKQIGDGIGKLASGAVNSVKNFFTPGEPHLPKYPGGEGTGEGQGDQNPTAKPAAKGSKSGGSFTTQDEDPYTDKKTQTEALTDAQEKLDARLKAMDASLNIYREGVKQATTVEGELQAKHNLESETIAELQKAMTLLINRINDEKAARGPLTAQQKEAIANYDETAKKINALNAQIQAHGEKTDEDDNKLSKLKDTLAKQKTAIDEANSAIKTNSDNLKKNTDELDANVKKLTEQKDASAAALLEWNKYKDAADQKATEASVTQGKTTKQLVDYYNDLYQQDLANFTAAWNAKDDVQMNVILPKLKADYQQYIDDIKKMDEEQVASAKANWDTEESYVQTFVDDVVSKHKSMADALKDIFKSIEDAWIKTFSKNLTTQLFGAQPGATGANTATANGASGGGIFGQLGSLFGGLFNGGQSSSGYTGPDMANASFSTGSGDSWTQTITALTGSPTGVSPTSVTAQANTSSSVSSMGGAFSGLSGAIGGFALGSGLGQAVGGGSTPASSTDSTVGGVIGAAGAAAFGLPPGVGSAVGSFLGSLFGPKASNEPDIYNTQAWGQGLANLQGSGVNGQPIMIANGQQFVSQANSQLGGFSELQYIANYLQQNPGSNVLGAGYTKEFSGLSTTGGNIIGGKNGNLELQNGVTVNWQQLISDAANAITSITSSFSNGVYILQRTFPNLQNGSIAQWGTFNNGTGTPLSTQTNNNTVPQVPTQQPVTVNIHNPVINGTKGIQDLANQIKQTLSRNSSLGYANQGFS